MSSEELLDWMQNNSHLIEAINDMSIEDYCSRFGIDSSTLTDQQQVAVERFMTRQRNMESTLTA